MRVSGEFGDGDMGFHTLPDEIARKGVFLVTSPSLSKRRSDARLYITYLFFSNHALKKEVSPRRSAQPGMLNTNSTPRAEPTLAVKAASGNPGPGSKSRAPSLIRRIQRPRFAEQSPGGQGAVGRRVARPARAAVDRFGRADGTDM